MDLRKTDKNFDILNHPTPLSLWGRISAIGSAPYLEFRALTQKDRKTKMITTANDYAKLKHLESAEQEAKKRNLDPNA